MLYLNILLQQYQQADTGTMLVSLCGGVIGYVYFSYCLMAIALKTNTDDAWFAWIPILNLFLMMFIAKKNACLYIILSFIPIVNLFVMWDVWASIAEERGKDRSLGCLMFIPIVNIIIPGYLAFSD